MQPTETQSLRIWLALGHSLDLAQWAPLHAAGDVPDVWPYGLDRLRDHGIETLPRPPLRGLDQLPARVGRQLGGFQWWEALRQPAPAAADAVVCWDERAGAPLALRERHRPVATGVIWATESSAGARSGLSEAVTRAALRRAGAVWALSSAQLPVLRERFGVAERRLHHLVFGVDADFFLPGGAPEPDLVVSVGNDRHRDHRTVVDAMRCVQARRPPARLSLVTRAPVEVPAALGRRIQRLDHRGIREQYQRASVVAVALRRNLHVSGVTVALEAMACGRPVVITATPGMSDYVDDGVTGVLVPPGDPVSMSETIGGLLADPDRAAAMGAAGRTAVEQRFNTATQAALLASIIGSALG